MGENKKYRLSIQALEVLNASEAYLRSMIDGKPHGPANGCTCPLDARQALYLRSWVLPKLEHLNAWGRGEAGLERWMAQ